LRRGHGVLQQSPAVGALRHVGTASRHGLLCLSEASPEAVDERGRNSGHWRRDCGYWRPDAVGRQMDSIVGMSPGRFRDLPAGVRSELFEMEVGRAPAKDSSGGIAHRARRARPARHIGRVKTACQTLAIEDWLGASRALLRLPGDKFDGFAQKLSERGLYATAALGHDFSI